MSLLEIAEKIWETMQSLPAVLITIFIANISIIVKESYELGKYLYTLCENKKNLQKEIDADTLWKERMRWIKSVRDVYSGFVVSTSKLKTASITNYDYDKALITLQEKIALLELHFCPDSMMSERCNSNDYKDRMKLHEESNSILGKLEDNSGKNDLIVNKIEEIGKDLKGYRDQYCKYKNAEKNYIRCIKCRTKILLGFSNNEIEEIINIGTAEGDYLDNKVNSNGAKIKYKPILLKGIEVKIDNGEELEERWDYDQYDCPEDCPEAFDDNDECNMVMNKYNQEIMSFIDFNDDLERKSKQLLDAVRCYIKVEWNRNKKMNSSD